MQHRCTKATPGSASVGWQFSLASSPHYSYKRRNVKCCIMQENLLSPLSAGFLRSTDIKSELLHLLKFFALLCCHPQQAPRMGRLSPGFPIHPLRCVSWSVAPLVWNIALRCLEFALRMFQWFTTFHNRVYPKYCTYLLPSGTLQENVCAERKGHFF